MSTLPWLLSILSIPLGGLLSDRLAKGRLGPVWGRRTIPIIGIEGSGALIALGVHTGSAVTAAVALALATALVLSPDPESFLSRNERVEFAAISNRRPTCAMS